MALVADVSTVKPQERFTVDVLVYAGDSNPVDGGQVFMDFDPEVFRVIDMSGGESLSEVLHFSFNDELGRIGYAAGTLEEPIKTPFRLVSVRFEGVAITGGNGSSVAFAAPAPPRVTKTVYLGDDNIGKLRPPLIVVVAADS